MISDELLAELKQILWEDYQIQLTDSDLKLFAEALKGMYSHLTQAVSKKREKLSAIVEQNIKQEQSNTND
jgi:hypothetical protein